MDEVTQQIAALVKQAAAAAGSMEEQAAHPTSADRDPLDPDWHYRTTPAQRLGVQPAHSPSRISLPR
jgi:hypothetical protein